MGCHIEVSSPQIDIKVINQGQKLYKLWLSWAELKIRSKSFSEIWETHMYLQ